MTLAGVVICLDTGLLTVLFAAIVDEAFGGSFGGAGFTGATLGFVAAGFVPATILAGVICFMAGFFTAGFGDAALTAGLSPFLTGAGTGDRLAGMAFVGPDCRTTDRTGAFTGAAFTGAFFAGGARLFLGAFVALEFLDVGRETGRRITGVTRFIGALRMVGDLGRGFAVDAAADFVGRGAVRAGATVALLACVLGRCTARCIGLGALRNTGERGRATFDAFVATAGLRATARVGAVTRGLLAAGWTVEAIRLEVF